MRAGLARFARYRMAVFSAAVLLCLFLLVALTPIIYPDDPFKLVGPALQPPGGRFWLGTDTLGRDVAAEIAYGARTSLIIGVGATLAAIIFGAAIGGLAGYYRGKTETALMRVTEFFQTIPAFIFALLIVAILSPSVTSEIIAIAAVSWPSIARLVRGEFVALGGREFAGLRGPRRQRCAHHLPSYAAELRLLHHCGRFAVDRHRDIARSRSGVSGARRPQHHELGADHQRGARGAALRLVDLHFSGHRDPAHGARHQSHRRWAQRSPQSKAK